MDNLYQILGVAPGAPADELKRAFRERAKRLHPDIAGEAGQEAMRRLLAAYEVLGDAERRAEYDRAYERFVAADPRRRSAFDYRSFLKETPSDPESQSKLIFYDLLHLEEVEAIAVWRRMGGLDYRLEDYLDREDWMDCVFILAEELDKVGDPYCALRLLASVTREERRRPYFRHFMPEVDDLVREIVRARLLAAAPPEAALECLEELLDIGYPQRDEARWLRTAAELLEKTGDRAGAAAALRSALKREPGLPNVVQLRRRLKV